MYFSQNGHFVLVPNPERKQDLFMWDVNHFTHIFVVPVFGRQWSVSNDGHGFVWLDFDHANHRMNYGTIVRKSFTLHFSKVPSLKSGVCSLQLSCDARVAYVVISRLDKDESPSVSVQVGVWDLVTNQLTMAANSEYFERQSPCHLGEFLKAVFIHPNPVKNSLYAITFTYDGYPLMDRMVLIYNGLELQYALPGAKAAWCPYGKTIAAHDEIFVTLYNENFDKVRRIHTSRVCPDLFITSCGFSSAREVLIHGFTLTKGTNEVPPSLAFLWEYTVDSMTQCRNYPRSVFRETFRIVQIPRYFNEPPYPMASNGQSQNTPCMSDLLCIMKHIQPRDLVNFSAACGMSFCLERLYRRFSVADCTGWGRHVYHIKYGSQSWKDFYTGRIAALRKTVVMPWYAGTGSPKFVTIPKV